MLRILSGFVIVFLCGTTPAVAQLPPEILADHFLLQVEQQMAQKEHEGALESLQKILTLQKEGGLILPGAFHFKYAQVAFAAGSFPAALESVNQYMVAGGNDGKFYKQALELAIQAVSEQRTTQGASARARGDAAAEKSSSPSILQGASARARGDASGCVTPKKGKLDERRPGFRVLRYKFTTTCTSDVVIEISEWNMKKEEWRSGGRHTLWPSQSKTLGKDAVEWSNTWLGLGPSNLESENRKVILPAILVKWCAAYYDEETYYARNRRHCEPNIPL